MVVLASLVFALLATTRGARAQDTAPPPDSTITTPSTPSSTGNRLADMARQTTIQAPYPGVDSLAASVIGIRFVPVYTNKIAGDVSSVLMNNGFRTAMQTPWGSLFNFQVSLEEKHYRLQDKFDENNNLSAYVIHTFNVFTKGSLGFTDSRVFNRSIIPGGRFQDYIFNDKSVNGTAVYQRRLLPGGGPFKSFAFDASGRGSAVQGERTYKDDQTLAAAASGGFTGELRSRLARVDARGGHRETWDRSETSLTVFDDLGSTEDSLSTGVFFEMGDSILVDADYVYYEAQRLWADQAQGSLGSQQGGVENVFQESERKSVRSSRFAVRAKVLDDFRLTVSGTHDKQLLDYAVQKTRFSNTVGDGIKGEFSYVAPWKTVATVSLENNKTLRDFGPLSVSSYDDTRRLASMSLTHRFHKDFNIQLDGSTQLTRSEYLDKEANPRDRDQVDTSAGLKITSRLHERLTGTVNLGYSASDFINIDSSQSENNRTRRLYELRPGFVYIMNQYFIVTQTYGVVIEYTEFDYTEEDNFLDRNLIFTNRFDFRPMRRVKFVLDYSYNFHDNGSYLPDPITGNDELSVQGEDRRDRVIMRVNYNVLQRMIRPINETVDVEQQFSIFAEQRYNRFEDRSVLTDSKTVTTDGQITVGTEGRYNWGKGRSFNFMLARVKRFARFGSDKEKDYWDMRSEFVWPF